MMEAEKIDYLGIVDDKNVMFRKVEVSTFGRIR